MSNKNLIISANIALESDRVGIKVITQTKYIYIFKRDKDEAVLLRNRIFVARTRIYFNRQCFSQIGGRGKKGGGFATVSSSYKVIQKQVFRLLAYPKNGDPS
jgi:hypothetical protein